MKTMKLARPLTEPADIVEYLAKGLAAHATPFVLNDEQKAALLRALSSRGPRKGYLKTSAPSRYDDPMGYAAWHGLQPNPYKMSIFAAVAPPSGEARELITKLQEYNFPAWLDYDRHALQSMGAW